MADPYATRAPGPAEPGELPSGPPPWEGAVAERGGEALALGHAPDAGAALHYVRCRDVRILPPLARVGPELAVLLVLEAAPVDDRDAAAANRLLGELREPPADAGRGGGKPTPLLVIKQGSVAGPEGRPGCIAVGEELIAATLDALLAGTLEWEEDPDFGYEVPAHVPGLSEAQSRALLPRLLYADNDRAYEHAALVAERKRALHDVAAALTGLDEAVIAASGWPPRPTGSEWRDR